MPGGGVESGAALLNLPTLSHVVWRATFFFLATVNIAAADFHAWTINEIYSNADGSVQFVELFNTTDREDLLATHGATISSSLNVYTFDVDLPDFLTANRFLLVGTVSYASAPGAVTPDYTVEDNFFSVNGDTVIFASVDALDFSMTGLPVDGVLSIDPDLISSPNSPTNFDGEIGLVLLPEPGGLLPLGAGLGFLALIPRRRYRVRG
jgi:hypothetical protein